MVFEVNSYQRLFQIVNNSENLAEVFKQAESYCQNCKIISPMICIQKCEIWKAKNELLEMSKLLRESNHARKLFNAIKNKRRLKIMEALSERAYTIGELQEYLKKNGYYHSQRTISNEYLKPLLRVGLIKKDGNKYRPTLYGRKFHGILSKFNSEKILPSHSQCYEESILMHLIDGPKSYDELAELITQKSLSRILKRLREGGMIAKNQSPNYVFYFKTKKEPNVTFSPTEKRVYEAIPETGIPARALSKEVGISLRRTYKYIRRLTRKRLIFARKQPRTYELTSFGREIAACLKEMSKLVSSALQYSVN
jgi:DNA-binding HxlR family transcriptional regulator